jgi:riboflavin kinase/FMN adenylyltransferase
MRVIRESSELGARGRKVCVAIGVFDGVHLGHEQVIRQMIADAEQHEAVAVVITFDRHPNAVVAPDRTPELIYSLPQKLRAIQSLGAEVTWLIGFNPDFSRQSGEEFIRNLARDFGNVQSVCVGSTFTFGHKRSGNVELLRKLGADLRFTVHGLAAVALDGEVVSSTRIRDAIRSGQLDAASQMLGRGYALAGTVIRGDGIGKKFGYPTANLDTPGLVLPPNGVYAGHARLGDQSHRAVLNIGVRPTLEEPKPRRRVEVHLLGFKGEIYDQELEVTFTGKLRDERKFESVDALRAQIGRDVETARELFGDVET